MSEYLLEMKGIHKSFAGVHALDDVDFAIRPGIIASHVKARVNITSMAIITAHSKAPAFELNPIRIAARVIITTEMPLETSEVNTCAQSIDERDMGIE